MLEILLVFSINSAPPEVSDRVFASFEECAEFVNEVADGDVVNSDYAFRFLSSDQLLFQGQCMDSEDYWKDKEI